MLSQHLTRKSMSASKRTVLAVFSHLLSSETHIRRLIEPVWQAAPSSSVLHCCCIAHSTNIVHLDSERDIAGQQALFASFLSCFYM